MLGFPRLLPALVLIASACVGCASDAEPEAARAAAESEEAIVASAVVIVDARTAAIADVSEGRVVLPPGVAAPYRSLAPGSVIVGARGAVKSANPDGFLRKVVAISDENGALVITTAPATLTDALVRGAVKASSTAGTNIDNHGMEGSSLRPLADDAPSQLEGILLDFSDKPLFDGVDVIETDAGKATFTEFDPPRAGHVLVATRRRRRRPNQRRPGEPLRREGGRQPRHDGEGARDRHRGRCRRRHDARRAPREETRRRTNALFVATHRASHVCGGRRAGEPLGEVRRRVEVLSCVRRTARRRRGGRSTFARAPRRRVRRRRVARAHRIRLRDRAELHDARARRDRSALRDRRPRRALRLRRLRDQPYGRAVRGLRRHEVGRRSPLPRQRRGLGDDAQEGRDLGDPRHRRGPLARRVGGTPALIEGTLGGPKPF